MEFSCREAWLAWGLKGILCVWTGMSEKETVPMKAFEPLNEAGERHSSKGVLSLTADTLTVSTSTVYLLILVLFNILSPIATMNVLM